MTRRGGAKKRAPYRYLPRTSFIFGRLMERMRRNGASGQEPRGK